MKHLIYILMITLLPMSFVAPIANATDSSYQWRGANCYDIAPTGAIIQEVGRNYCRTHAGDSHYEWRGANCYDVAPNGAVIQEVGRNFCRNHSSSMNPNSIVAQLAEYQENAQQNVNTESRAEKTRPTVYQPVDTNTADSESGTAI
jgi:hypothetical protein